MTRDSIVHKERREICPYNKSHVVPADRMALHLVKCQKQNPGIVTKVCTFNATHHVREDDYNAHVESCNAKNVVEKTLYTQRTSVPSQVASNVGSFAVQDDDNWDSDQVHISYDPKQTAFAKEVFHSIPLGLGKSGRRQWRETEHTRVERAKSGTCLKDLKYPTPDGNKISLEEFTMCDKPVEPKCKTVYSRSKQSEINKKIMVVEDPIDLTSISLSPKIKKVRSRVAANIFSSVKPILQNLSEGSSIDEDNNDVIRD